MENTTISRKYELLKHEIRAILKNPRLESTDKNLKVYNLVRI